MILHFFRTPFLCLPILYNDQVLLSWGWSGKDILKSLLRSSSPTGIKLTYLEGHQNSPRSDSSLPCQPLPSTTSFHSPYGAKLVTTLLYVCKTSFTSLGVSPTEFTPCYILYLSVITFSIQIKCQLPGAAVGLIHLSTTCWFCFCFLFSIFIEV